MTEKYAVHLPRRRMLQDWADYLDAQTAAGIATLKQHEVPDIRPQLYLVQ